MTSWYQVKLIKRNPSGQPSSCISDYKLTPCKNVLDEFEYAGTTISSAAWCLTYCQEGAGHKGCRHSLHQETFIVNSCYNDCLTITQTAYLYNRCRISSVGRELGRRAECRGFDSRGRTTTQGFKINEKWRDFRGSDDHVKWRSLSGWGRGNSVPN